MRLSAQRRDIVNRARMDVVFGIDLTMLPVFPS